MFGFSIWHLLIVLLVVVLIFGRGRIAALMGEFGHGINAFRREMRPEPKTWQQPVRPAITDGTKVEPTDSPDHTVQ